MALAYVHGHDDTNAPGLDHRVEELHVDESGRAEHDPRGSGRQGLAHVHQRAQPAAVLDGHAQLARDPPQVLEVHRPALARAVEVDNVERARAGLHEAPGRL